MLQIRSLLDHVLHYQVISILIAITHLILNVLINSLFFLVISLSLINFLNCETLYLLVLQRVLVLLELVLVAYLAI